MKENNKLVATKIIENPIEDTTAKLTRLNKIGVIADQIIMMIPSPETKRNGNNLPLTFFVRVRSFAGVTFHIVLSES